MSTEGPSDRDIAAAADAVRSDADMTTSIGDLLGKQSALSDSVRMALEMSKPGNITPTLAHVRSAAQAFDEYAEEQRLESQDRLLREQQGLELTAQLVEQQRLLVEQQSQLVAEQLRQAEEAKATRRIEWAVLILSALALIATVVGVAVALGQA